MTLGFKVSARIARPVAEVFDAVVNPKQLSGYFTTIGGPSAPLVTGTTVTWWGDVPVEVDEVVPKKSIVLRWDASVAAGEAPYKTRIEMSFEPGGRRDLGRHRRSGLAGRRGRPAEILPQLRRLVADALLHEGPTSNTASICGRAITEASCGASPLANPKSERPERGGRR